MRRSLPSPALSELLASTGELDQILSGAGLAFERVPDPPSPPPSEPFVFGPWDGSSFVQPTREPDPALHREDVEPLPAKPKRRAARALLDEIAGRS